MPRPKKHPSARARANRASSAATLTGEDSGVVRPDLPEGREWHSQTVEWWNDLWAAPMAGEYHSSDRHALFVLAALVDDFWLKPSKPMAAEIRMHRQAFGLTPYDRRRLEWTIESAEESKARGRKRVQREPSEPPKDDPRSALYAV